MITYPYQKRIVVEEDRTNSTDIFNNLRKDTICAASRELSTQAFKVYLYLVMNKNGYEFALSSQDLQKTMGISDSSHKRGVRELTEKGWLIPLGGNKFKIIKNKWIG